MVNIPLLAITAMEGRRSERSAYLRNSTLKGVGKGSVGKSAELAET